MAHVVVGSGGVRRYLEGFCYRKEVVVGRWSLGRQVQCCFVTVALIATSIS